ncbi:alpha/beta hydrolase [Tenacibaculum finnmarkense]|uniref:alpha/beta hydrolase n=1 Tax=Tenacibaculum finnmarkense TaxID=2781243 RepID=UPI000C553B9E|nr:alpha/beta hydrolase [Tenacibaculum finnmarkense]MCD8440375.1 alpha/beta hydrolase [Tenacibaculum finnmarkense genomovar ulcerans]MCG8721251.1 alpha/beta hydrolase [Tenacibaculum finnmarkense]SOS55132.1 Alpha/beta hydrolase [Tenacibaculum finnmarkense]
MTHQEFHFKYHNTNFFGQFWQPKNPNSVKAVVIIVHGMGEHSGRYQSVAKNLTDANFGVIAFDHFGHGKTTGKRGHNPGFDAVLTSISQLIEKASAVFGDKPQFLYGHSMGGNAVINYALRKEFIQKNKNLIGVIATSPMLKLAFNPPAWKLKLGKIMQKIAPSITLSNELDISDISRDEVEVQKYLDDPLVHDKISPNFSLSFIDAGKWAIDNAQLLQIPMFVLHGTADKIIDYKGSQEFANATKNANLKLYKGAYHELQHDLCKDEMLKDVIHWLENQLKKAQK